MTLVFLLEERSAKEFSEGLLPRILPPTVGFLCVSHEGKSDLRRRLSSRLAAWKTPNCRFIVVHDQDAADCVALKLQLRSLVDASGRSDAVIRIACRELEAWILGDLDALAVAFGVPSIASLKNKEKFRVPDLLGNPSQELRSLLPAYQKVSGARRVAAHLEPSNNSSPSFQTFLAAVLRLSEKPPML